jgi:hypothetical protein
MLTPTERRTGSSVARSYAARGFVVSLAIHAALATAILGAAWGVARTERQDPPPVVLVADFFDPAPTETAEPTTARSEEKPKTNATERDPPKLATDHANDLAAQLRALEAASAASPEMDALARKFGALAPPNSGLMEADARPASRFGASFAGLVAGNATKIAYVVDASGSMLGSFPNIVNEVERSIEKLEASQQFTVICFRRDGAEAPKGDPSLRPASRAERAAAVRWLRTEVVPSGRSSPIEALAMALRSGADCVFLLSTTITGPGRHELDRDSLLAMLDRLNPVDPSSGLRRATIQCVQFLEEDPGRTLEAVAAAHFGEGGYRFVSRLDAGLDAGSGSRADPQPDSPGNADSARERPALAVPAPTRPDPASGSRDRTDPGLQTP